eukprot:tig00000944_g5974.t1
MGVFKEILATVSNPQTLLKIPKNLDDISFMQAWVFPPLITMTSYFLVCGLEFLYFFCYKREKYFPGYKPDWPLIRQEMTLSLFNGIGQSIVVAMIFRLNIRGYGKIYLNVDEYGYTYLALSFIGFLLWAETTLYWIHRALHTPFLYKYVHKHHHQFTINTPFTSMAFHPLDGFIQSASFHLASFVVPVNVWVYFGLLEFMSIWSFSIHDRLHVANNGWLLGARYHTVHHAVNSYNYGQFFTFWDKLGGTLKDYEGEDIKLQEENQKLASSGKKAL